MTGLPGGDGVVSPIALRLAIDPPAGARVAVAAPAHARDADRWLRDTLDNGARRIQVDGNWASQTDTGWPMTIRIFAIDDDAIAIVADYQFFDLTAHAAVIGLRRHRLDDDGATVVAALATAHPDWEAAPPVEISGLWS